MRKANLKDYLTADELRQRMRGTEQREQFQRWQALYLTRLGLSASAVAQYVGVSSGTVHQWVHRHNRAGPEEMVLAGRGGRRFGLLSLEQEARLLEGLRSEAEQGQVVAAFRIRQEVEKKAGYSCFHF
jgi:transposase